MMRKHTHIPTFSFLPLVALADHISLQGVHSDSLLAECVCTGFKVHTLNPSHIPPPLEIGAAGLFQHHGQCSEIKPRLVHLALRII